MSHGSQSLPVQTDPSRMKLTGESGTVTEAANTH